MPEGAGRFTYDKIPARQCSVEDFNAAYGEEFGAARLKDWTGFSLICPDLNEGQDLMIKGSKASMKASVAMMEIRKCDKSRSSPGDPTCHIETDINDYIEDMQIDTWIAYNKINFQEHVKSPLFRVTENFGIFLADKTFA